MYNTDVHSVCVNGFGSPLVKYLFLKHYVTSLKEIVEYFSLKSNVLLKKHSV